MRPWTGTLASSANWEIIINAYLMAFMGKLNEIMKVKCLEPYTA